MHKLGDFLCSKLVCSVLAPQPHSEDNLCLQMGCFLHSIHSPDNETSRISKCEALCTQGERESMQDGFYVLGIPLGVLITVFYMFRKCEETKPIKSAECLKIASQN